MQQRETNEKRASRSSSISNESNSKTNALAGAAGSGEAESSEIPLNIPVPDTKSTSSSVNDDKASSPTDNLTVLPVAAAAAASPPVTDLFSVSKDDNLSTGINKEVGLILFSLVYQQVGLLFRLLIVQCQAIKVAMCVFFATNN